MRLHNRLLSGIVGLTLAAALATTAWAQAQFSTPAPGVVVPGIVQMCLNTAGLAVPTSSGACAGGSGGGAASTVTANQGTAGAVPWLMSLSNTSIAVTQSGAWTVGITGALPAGTNAIGAVSQGAAGAAPWLISWSGQSVAVSNFPATQPVSGTVAVSTLPALPAGANAIGSVAVSNLPASQPVTNAGTFPVQNTAAIVGGNTAAVKVDGSAVTQPVAAAALPLPAGASTVASQTAVQSASGTAQTTAITVQGNGSSIALPVSAVALPLPAGAASAANQNATAAGTSAANAQAVQGATGGVPMPVTVTNPTVTANQGTAGAAPWPVGEASGANVTMGATTDAPLTAPATAAPSTLNATEKGILNALLNGTAKMQEATWWIEANGTAVAASANFLGTARSNGSVAGGPSPFGYFQVQLFTTQAGTLYIYNNSYSGGTNAVSATAVTAGSYTIVKVPALGSNFYAGFFNGATAGIVNMSDGYTAN